METPENLNYLDTLLRSCRVCAAQDTYANLFYNINRELLRNLISILQCDIKDRDGFSRWLCRECTERVEEFTKFRNQYEETSSVVLNLLKGPSKTDDPVVDTIEATEQNETVDTFEIEALDESVVDASPVESRQAEVTITFPVEKSPHKEVNTSTVSSSTLNLYCCEFCEKFYKHSNSLARHVLTVHGNLRHICSMCSSSFTQKSSLNEHMRSIHGNDSLFCEHCNKSFGTKKILRQHMKIHSVEWKSRKPKTPSKVYRRQCPICGGFFKNIEEHKLTHQKEKSFKCNFPDCLKTFKFISSLKAHMRVHNDERNFKCEACDKRFRVSHHLKEHMSTHSGLKEFICDFEGCVKKFSSKLNLYKHTKLHKNKATDQ